MPHFLLSARVVPCRHKNRLGFKYGSFVPHTLCADLTAVLTMQAHRLLERRALQVKPYCPCTISVGLTITCTIDNQPKYCHYCMKRPAAASLKMSLALQGSSWQTWCLGYIMRCGSVGQLCQFSLAVQAQTSVGKVGE